MALHAEILAQSAQCTVSEGGSQGKSPEERNRTTLLYYMLCRASSGLRNALGGVGACEPQRTLPNLRQTAGMTGSDAHEGARDWESLSASQRSALGLGSCPLGSGQLFLRNQVRKPRHRSGHQKCSLVPAGPMIRLLVTTGKTPCIDRLRRLAFMTHVRSASDR